MLKKRKSLTMPEIRRFIIQVSGAVKYLHARNIVHRDLKTGNLFLDEHMNVKVGDFGLAALLVNGKDMEAIRRTTMCGTPNYLAPEILAKGKGHNDKVDLWAIGIIACVYVFASCLFPSCSSLTPDILLLLAKPRSMLHPRTRSTPSSRPANTPGLNCHASTTTSRRTSEISSPHCWSPKS